MFSGIYPVLYAFFAADGRLDETAMRRQVRACLASGAHGIAVLGLITEVGSLSGEERRAIIAWAAEEIEGRVPLAVTIGSAPISAQIASAREAANLGADWVIFQPPDDAEEERALMHAFGHAADAVDLPFGIQNAPQYLGRGLAAPAIQDLHRTHPNFGVLKGEVPATDIAGLVEACGDGLSIFNGRGGLELPDVLRAGAAGMIPAPECCDVQAQIYEAMRNGAENDAEKLYRRVLPLIVFVMQSIEASLIYGKRITAARLGLESVHDRDPALVATSFGLACARSRSAGLSAFPMEGPL